MAIMTKYETDMIRAIHDLGVSMKKQNNILEAISKKLDKANSSREEKETSEEEKCTI